MLMGKKKGNRKKKGKIKFNGSNVDRKKKKSLETNLTQNDIPWWKENTRSK